jgi:hypothetical protein
MPATNGALGPIASTDTFTARVATSNRRGSVTSVHNWWTEIGANDGERDLFLYLERIKSALAPSHQ